jgi:hypothetical protein
MRLFQCHPNESAEMFHQEIEFTEGQAIPSSEFNQLFDDPIDFGKKKEKNISSSST